MVYMNLVHSINLLFGSWMVWVGYSYLKGKAISNIENTLLVILGIIMTLYQSWLWYKYPKTKYHYNLPGWVVNSSHMLSGILLTYLGLSTQTQNLFYDLSGISLIILGSMAALYHLHIFAFENHNEK